MADFSLPYSHFVLLKTLNPTAPGEKRRSWSIQRGATERWQTWWRPRWCHPGPSSCLRNDETNAFQRANQLIKNWQFKLGTAGLTPLLLFSSLKPLAGSVPSPGAAPASQSAVPLSVNPAQRGCSGYWGPGVLSPTRAGCPCLRTVSTGE